MKAFLSSTYSDLTEHRKAASEALQRLGQQVGQMEVFGARPEEPTRASLHEVEQADIFVGIYAHRYGFIPDGSDISITEMELDHAIKCKKPVFCFLVNVDHPWPPKMIETGPGAEKLQHLKARINSGFVRDTFTTSEDLAFRLGTAVGGYLIREKPSGGPVDTYARELLACGDIVDLLESTLHHLEDITRTDYNQVFLVATATYAKQLICVADGIPSHKQRYRVATFAGLLGSAVSLGKTINAGRVHERPGYFQAVPETRSEIVVPISHGTAVLGVLNSEAEQEEWYDPAKQGDTERLAAAVASVLGSFGWSPGKQDDELPWICREPRYRSGEQAAAPNDGPATPPGNSGDLGGGHHR